MDVGAVLFNIAAFIVAVGLLVTVHEFGHYWVARRLGVKVLRFSVGFGRPLLKRTAGADRTEYVVAAVPLGGYVKMLDEREGDVPAADLPRAFNRQSVYRRMAIVAAGPMFNFLFAVAAYWLMFVIGVAGVKPIVGDVEPGSPADVAGFKSQEEILAVEGEPTPTWESARFAILEAGIDGEGIRVQVRDDAQVLHERLLVPPSQGLLKQSDTDLLTQLGLEPWRPPLPPVIAEVSEDGAAAAGGLRAGDRVLSADGEAVRDVDQWISIIQAHPGEELPVQVRRDGELVELVLRPRPKGQDGEQIGFIGASITVEVPDELRERMRAVVRHGPLEAIGTAAVKTWDMSVLTLRVLGKLVIGEADLRNISGPITIAQYAGLSASLGIEKFLSFLAVVSISLGILNLLPIPVLDGGHLFYYVIEVVKGSPLSEAAEAIGQRIGLALLMLLMTVAFYNDILRLMS
jgi:regulator of sigma E protease